MKTIQKDKSIKSKSKNKKRSKSKSKKKTTNFDDLAASLGQSIKGVEKSIRSKEIKKNEETNKKSLFSKMKKKRLDKQNLRIKNLEEDQKKVQLIMNNTAFTDNPLDMLLSHVANAVSTKNDK
mmetsp:Transcript_17642/g.15558  ORF Transcript_17642/g.15558 Transcript_17642/m.15558 type:complete len:123 (+) Transcript_17642:10-378(+)